ncbi:MAG: putative Ig domain-containing protein, partial [Synergistaceae bacterium]|nr:putative Ig domain-containing protein [Synergistaceae bacterium]
LGNYDTNGDGILSAEEAANVSAIWVPYSTIADLKGIEYFTALTELRCYNNRLTALDVSNNTALMYLHCDHNQLTALDVSKNIALTHLYCHYNQLTELDVSNNAALNNLNCDGNQLTTLDLSKNTALTYLACDYNQLTALDVSKNTALNDLWCSNNQLTELNLSGCTALTILYCESNHLAELDVSNCPDDIYIGCDSGVRILRNKPTLISSLVDITTNTPVSVFRLRSNVLDATAQLIEAVVKSGIITDTGTKETLNKVARGLQIISSIYSGDFFKRFFTNILIPSILKSSGDDGDTEKFQLSESLSLNVTPGVFKTSEGTVKITLASSRDLSNDVYCMIASGDSGRFFKVPASAGSRRVFTAEFNAGELFASLDAGMIDIMCVSCVSDDEGICGMLMSNTAFVDWLKKDNTPDDTPPDNTPPEILTEYLADAITGTAYSVQLQSYGTTPITWTKSGTFPRGLTFSTSGLISGTPTKAGSFNITFTAKNAYGKVSKKLKLTVIEPVKITTASLKAGTIGKTYSVTLKAKGTKPITWSAEGLPSGLTINTKTGKISGKPTEYGQFSVNVTAENAAGSVTRTLPLTVKAIAPTLSGSLKKPTLNVPYSSGLKLSKGTVPITWSISGTLPTGLKFDTKTGIISGTPTSYAKSGYKITITAKNDAGSKSKRITLKVNGKAPVIKATLPKTATYGQPYNATLKATGSIPITFTVDRLPAGLSLNDGVISGTVTETTKSFKFTVYATNPVKTVKKSFTLKINTPKSKKETPPENTENDSDSETPSDNNAVEPNVTDNTENQTQTGNPQTDNQTESQKSGVPEGYVIVAELGTVSRDEAGMYDFDVALSDDVPAGAELMYIANSDLPSDDDEIAEFFDSTGNEITAVPEDRKISISIWLNPNTIYHPAIAVKH